MLFSEPKIPQSHLRTDGVERSDKFQCSSASRKFLKGIAWALWLLPSSGFSALQRAENSSKDRVADVPLPELGFQCSSASRKFLKRHVSGVAPLPARVSVLFSEPKIPQTARGLRRLRRCRRVSVLFSEPKIPQTPRFRPGKGDSSPFQCSSASRKFLKIDEHADPAFNVFVSVLFSEPKIPQIASDKHDAPAIKRFSALQRAENSSKVHDWPKRILSSRVSVLFSEPKIPQIAVNLATTGIAALFQCSSASRKFLKSRT